MIKVMQARPPKKGKTLIYPWHTLIEFLGAEGAVERTGSQSSRNAEVRVPDSVYSIYPRVLKEVSHMVISLPTHEVTQAQLDEEIQKLASAAFPDENDLVQQSMWSQYVCSAASCLDYILETNQKVIVQGTQIVEDQGG